MSKNTGGPAFPGSYTGNNGMPVWSNGMTLRDYFAAKAMQGIHANAHEDVGFNSISGGWDQIAAYAYAQADAMLAARDKV